MMLMLCYYENEICVTEKKKTKKNLVEHFKIKKRTELAG